MNDISKNEKAPVRKNDVVNYSCKFDIVISVVFLVAVSVYWVMLIPVSAYRVRLSYAIMHPAYLITYTIFFVYLGVFIAKLASKILGKPLKVKCATSLYADFVSLLLGFMIIFGSKVLLIGLIPFRR